ncbi:predicted protein [Naegleria gruberi]|uniref:Predicted protein n=1 Tax=Naegleria gruberi TaxID=5762 RepID=D2VL00_NAEGR|nr:uncharacterized protein NAEGRDRAFT_69611 [Naegleria gruberi]EFC42534.1 predicted protein [Naegleria gruberi]|eukprot:XP_002675278.1 predicted protein [Naegleria gruberi strain NEG-M]
MTEFYDLGAHCCFDGCHEKDFLPFKCTHCGKTFCLNHRSFDAHKCSYLQEQGVVAPFCPLCNQVLPFRASERENPNDVVERHISSGKCPAMNQNASKQPTSSLSSAEMCALGGCGQKSIIKCKGCNKSFCVEHRLDFDHNCDSLKKQKSRSGGSSSIGPFNIKSGSSVPITANKWKGQRKDAGKLLSNQFQNKPLFPVGQSSIATQDRYFLDVYFPINNQIQPIHMFFSKTWSVGKVLDKIAEQGKVKNNNSTELDLSKRLNLFNFDGVKLPTDKKLSELPPSLLKSRDGIILEYGEALDPTVIDQTLKDISEGSSSGCLIC